MADSRSLYGCLIRLHVLRHAGERLLYGQWMIKKFRRHGHLIEPEAVNPLLNALAAKGHLRSKLERAGRRYGKVYRVTLGGKSSQAGPTARAGTLWRNSSPEPAHEGESQ